MNNTESTQNETKPETETLSDQSENSRSAIIVNKTQTLEKESDQTNVISVSDDRQPISTVSSNENSTTITSTIPLPVIQEVVTPQTNAQVIQTTATPGRSHQDRPALLSILTQNNVIQSAVTHVTQMTPTTVDAEIATLDLILNNLMQNNKTTLQSMVIK